MLIALFDRLCLEGNQLSAIPDSIGQLTNLTEYGIPFDI
jgi:Leucine-rich repeat (LRR) protein